MLTESDAITSEGSLESESAPGGETSGLLSEGPGRKQEGDRRGNCACQEEERG